MVPYVVSFFGGGGGDCKKTSPLQVCITTPPPCLFFCARLDTDTSVIFLTIAPGTVIQPIKREEDCEDFFTCFCE